MVTFGDVTNFASKHPLAYMATVDGGRPQVKAMNMWKADGGGFYFHNNKKQDIWDQVNTNSKAQLLFAAPDGKTSLHVDGTLEFVPDPAVAAAFYASPGKGGFLNRGPLNPVIFRMAHGTAWFNPARGPKWERVKILEQVAF